MSDTPTGVDRQVPGPGDPRAPEATPPGRALVVFYLLQQGYAPAAIGRSLRVLDAGGAPAEALAVLLEHDPILGVR